MRPYLLILFVMCLTATSFAQSDEPVHRAGRSKPVIYSASSEWQKVTFKPTPLLHSGAAASPTTDFKRATRPVAPASAQNETISQTSTAPATSNAAGYHPAFTGDFATNRNGWRAGNKGDYNYQIGLGKYNIRKRNVNTKQVAFSYVQLPSDINLNIAETFTIKVDVVADSGRIPTGGLLFGVADSLNYSGFSLNSKGEITIVRVVNGQTADDYMPGDSFRPGVLLDKNRDRLMIRRNGEALHFYINDEEVRSSPYPFRTLAGNGIGFTTNGYWTSFQKLTVTLGQ